MHVHVDMVFVVGSKWFRLSDMIPNAWFYKLGDRSRGSTRTATDANFPRPAPPIKRSQHFPSNSLPKQPSFQPQLPPPPPHLESGRASYYIASSSTAVSGGPFSGHPVDPHRKSKKKRGGRSPPATTFRRDVNIASEYMHVLPPIVTKAAAKQKEPEPTGNATATTPTRRRRRSLAAIQRLRTRSVKSSPRIVTRKKLMPPPREVLSESIVVVKTSVDPEREFRDSMVEMIVENNITSGKDLEELLACYLSLNSNEFHDVIVEAFRQIWLDLNH